MMDLFGIEEFLNYSTTLILTKIFAKMVRSLCNGFCNLWIPFKIITLVPFLIYLVIGLVLVVVGFLTTVITFIPFLINKMGNLLLDFATYLSGDACYDEYNFFQIVLFPLLIYTAVFIALILIIVPTMTLSNATATF